MSMSQCLKTLFSSLFLVLSLISPQLVVAGQDRVANFFTGEHGTVSYEHFSFWVRENNQTEIVYSYGKDPKEAKVAILGSGFVRNEPCLKIRFQNGYVLNLLLKDSALLVTDDEGNIRKPLCGNTRAR
jgi:hypothetical protein